MPRVTVVLPRMLGEVLGAERIEVQAATVAAALEAAYGKLPTLRHHLCDDTGGLRVHILCMHNGVSNRDRGTLKTPVRDGDEIAIVQAISGG